MNEEWKRSWSAPSTQFSLSVCLHYSLSRVDLSKARRVQRVTAPATRYSYADPSRKVTHHSHVTGNACSTGCGKWWNDRGELMSEESSESKLKFLTTSNCWLLFLLFLLFVIVDQRTQTHSGSWVYCNSVRCRVRIQFLSTHACQKLKRVFRLSFGIVYSQTVEKNNNKKKTTTTTKSLNVCFGPTENFQRLKLHAFFGTQSAIFSMWIHP